jgi:hypothetical protein
MRVDVTNRLFDSDCSRQPSGAAEKIEQARRNIYFFYHYVNTVGEPNKVKTVRPSVAKVEQIHSATRSYVFVTSRPAPGHLVM